MCDTFVARQKATGDGSVIFGKSSDRDPNEAHEVRLVPAMDHPAGARLKCTYIEIDQVPHSYQVLLAKPLWLWGAEMGSNEHGVVIGNEAVFSRLPAGKSPGMIGMDYLRLGLERGRSAEEALKVMTALLEQHGQSGDCGYGHPFYYHNSFIIADRADAWILETAGRHWVAKKVDAVASISNAYTIGESFDLASQDVIHFAVEQGWDKRDQVFHFAKAYSDILYSTLGAGRSRQKCTISALNQRSGALTLSDGFSLLRDHSHGEKRMRLDQPVTGASVCMHAGFGPVRASQSVGSMVSHLTPDGDTHWLTGTSAPCISTFKPIWMPAGLPEGGWTAGPRYDAASLWWRHEKVHRARLGNFDHWLAQFQPQRDALESSLIQRASHQAGLEFTRECLAAGDALDVELQQLIQSAKPLQNTVFYYRSAWQGWSEKVGL